MGKLKKCESRCFAYLAKNMACFIRSSAFLNFLLTTHAWKNKNFFFHITIKYTFTLTSAGTLLGPRYFVIFVLLFLSDLQGTQSATGMC